MINQQVIRMICSTANCSAVVLVTHHPVTRTRGGGEYNLPHSLPGPRKTSEIL